MTESRNARIKWRLSPHPFRKALAVTACSAAALIDNAIWTRTLPAGGTLTRWRSIGGRATTAPAVANTLTEVFATGTDHAVWANDGSGWTRTGGRTYSAPAAGYIPQSNGGYVLIRGTDSALWADGIGGGGSTGWQPQPRAVWTDQAHHAGRT